MNRIYLNHDARIITPKDWGRDIKSNLKSLQIAAGVCWGNMGKVNAQNMLKKYVYNKEHFSVLEHTNYQLSLFRKPPKTRYKNVVQIRDWKVNKYKSFNKIDVFIGSMRDLIELFGMHEEYKSLNYPKEIFIWDDKIPLEEKRIQMLIRTNADMGHKLRTHRAISQLSLSPTNSKLYWDQELPIVVDKPELYMELFDNDYAKDQLEYKHYNENSKRGDNKLLYKENKKSRLPLQRINLRVLTGTIKDFRSLIEKRRKSPKYKRNVHCITDKIEEELKRYIDTNFTPKKVYNHVYYDNNEKIIIK